mgnify:CR=1 FL=1
MTLFLRRWLRIGLLLYVFLWCIALFRLLQTDPSFSVGIGDALSYSEAAANMVRLHFYSFDGLHPYFDREPGYSAFLALVYSAFGLYNRVAVFFVQGLLHAAAVLMFTRTLTRFLSDRIAVIVYLLLLTSPSVFHVIFSVLREGIALPLFMSLAIVLLYLLQASTMRRAIVAGTLLGMLILTVYSYVFLPVFIVCFFIFCKLPWRHMIPILLIPAISVCLWSSRTAYYTGEFRPIDIHRAAVMWHVRGQQAEHMYGMEPFRCLWAEYVSREWSGRSPVCS